MTVIWCMVPQIWSTTDIIFCHYGLFFALLPTNNTKNQNFEKMKTSADIIILHMYTINDNYMTYGCSWDIKCDGYCSDTIQILYCSWGMVCDRCNCSVFSFCKMAGEQSIALLALEFMGQGAWIAHKFFNLFLLPYNPKLGVLSKPWMIGTRTDIYARKTTKQV